MMVYLVGTGPGNPVHLTLEAVEAIGRADCVRWAPGSRAAIASRARLDANVAPFNSSDEIIELARGQRTVAVLYPGDPFVFGSGAQLALKLRRNNLPFAVVPGLVAETAIPTLAGVPLTVEGKAATIGLGLTRGAESLVLRLAAGWWVSGITALIEGGHSPKEKAALLVNGVRVTGMLGEVAKLASDRGLGGDAFLVVGEGVRLSEDLAGEAPRPLAGKKVLVTRARHQTELFRDELQRLGAEVIEIPTIEIKAIRDGAPIDDAVAKIDETGMFIFTSANAVDIFFSIVLERGRDTRGFHGTKVCAIGPETARHLEERGLKPDLVAGEYTAEGLAAALEGWKMDGMRVVVPRAKVARDSLPQLLAARGAQITIVPVYETVCPEGTGPQLQRLFEHDAPDFVTFTSSSTAVNFAHAFPDGALPDALNGTRVACMGPVTADTARKAGLPVHTVSREYTTAGLARAIAEYVGGTGG